MWVSVSCALALLVLETSSSSHGDALERESLDPTLSSRLRRIEAAFRNGDAGSLRLSCSSTGKVRVELPDLAGGQGSFGPGQLQVVFERIFEKSRTLEFGFGADEIRTPTPSTAFARGRWVRRAPPRGPELVETLTFTLREESRDWRILEIRSSR